MGEDLRLAVDFHVADGRPQGSLSYLKGIYEPVVHGRPGWDIIAVRNEISPSPWVPAGLRAEAYPKSSRAHRLVKGAAQASRKLKPDFFHFTYATPLGVSCRTILSVHDVLPMTHGHLFHPLKRRAFRAVVTHSARRASLLTTLSEHSRHHLALQTRIPAERIVIVPCGVDLEFFQPLPRGPTHDREMVNFLFVGRIEKRKNLDLIIRALAILRDKYGVTAGLDVVGSPENGVPHAEAAVAQTDTSSLVRFHGAVSQEELLGFYQRATALVFASEAEGFGIPPLEAMASGCPVIAADATSIPEVVGDAAITVPVGSVDGLAVAMHSLVDDRRLRLSYIQRGASRVRQFTWKRAAELLIGAIENLPTERGSI